MKTFIKSLILWLVLINSIGSSFAQIPSEYLPNSHINTAWTSILNTLTELQAYRKTGNDVPASMFATLNTNFKTVFKYFPNNPSYNLIYKQCELTTSKLTSSVNYDDYNTFVSKCFDPLSNILKDIQANFTIVSSLKANPRSWQAPLSVTFDASSSTDPSKETIPSDNFYRYYTNTQWQNVIIWKWPIVNHTFTTPGNYVVHNTVRSINNLRWYFDADNTITIVVQPTDTKINILANGIKLDENNPTKLSLSEGSQGITLDATSTTISVGKKIVKHTWFVTSNEWFSKSSNGEWVPWTLIVNLGNKWAYNVTLTTTDNTNTISTKTYQLILADPVSKIRSTPQAGSTSTQFSFDGDTSYSVSSKINLYRRDIYDSDSNVLITSQEKNVRYQFSKPWLYTVKLTVVDKQWLSDSSQTKVVVESTPPTPQFTINPTSDREQPSEFILDATNTYDYDILNSSDSLTFDRWFSDPENTSVTEQSPDNKQIKVQFNTKWTHKVKLKVTDSFGKSAEIIKDIIVKSSLRPIITIDPVAAPRWKKIDFEVTSNKELISYIWDFGDSTTRTMQHNTISHIFDKVGVYKVGVTVTSSEGEKNTVWGLVYIGENDAPIWVYEVYWASSKLLLPDETCEGVPAYSIPRYEPITIDSSKSVDTKGQRLNIKTLFKPQNDDVFTTSQLRYKFGELGCQKIEMIVEDKEELSADKKFIWFKVKNGLPRLNNIYLSFPQYQNDVGIWLFQYNAPKDPSFEQFDPLIVRVNMDNPIDLDGSISSIARYYYKPEDPERLLDIKVTPWNSNAVNFAISAEAWEYTFWAKLIDNDGWEITSEHIIGKGPSIFIKPKGNESVDIPLVTLKVDNSNTKIGEEVTFTVSSRILSARPDFKANRIIKYDFDGDGTDDLTTKDDIVKYVYTTPSTDGKPYKPKAKVLYREKVWVWYAEPIVVKKAVKPNFLIVAYDQKVLVRDLSFWADDKTQREYCMDSSSCSTSTIKDQTMFTYDYKDYGTKTITLIIKDQYGNTSTTSKTIDIKTPEKRLYLSLMSTPDNKQTTNGFELDVGKLLSNQIILYPLYQWTGQCYLDTTPNNDKDKDNNLPCNKVHTINVRSLAPTVYYTLYYENSKGMTNKIIAVNILDNQTIIPTEYTSIAGRINKLMEQYHGQTWYDTFVTILQWLGQNLWDKQAVTEYLIDLDQETKNITLSDNSKKELKAITDELATQWYRATQGLSDYERVKADIIAYANPTLETKLQSLFTSLEETSDKTKMYEYLSSLLQLYGQEVSVWTIDQTDYTNIKELVCKIVSIKEIPGTKCTDGEIQIDNQPAIDPTTNTDSDETNASEWGSSLLKWILWIIGGIVLIFIVLVIIFAIKARMDRSKVEAEHEWEEWEIKE